MDDKQLLYKMLLEAELIKPNGELTELGKGMAERAVLITKEDWAFDRACSSTVRAADS